MAARCAERSQFVGPPRPPRPRGARKRRALPATSASATDVDQADVPGAVRRMNGRPYRGALAGASAWCLVARQTPVEIFREWRVSTGTSADAAFTRGVRTGDEPWPTGVKMARTKPIRCELQALTCMRLSRKFGRNWRANEANFPGTASELPECRGKTPAGFSIAGMKPRPTGRTHQGHQCMD
jgi:hypothetical protein